MPSSSIFLRTSATSLCRPGASTKASISMGAGLDALFPFAVLTRCSMVHSNFRSPKSTPREWAVGGRVQLALSEPRKAERLKQRALLARQLLRHQLTDTNHLISVIGVGNHIDVLAERIEHRKIIRREAAEPAGVFVPPVKRHLALETLLTMRERRAPHLDEVVADHELGRLWAIRIDRHLVGILVDFVGRGAALHAAEAEVGLVIDAPQLVGDELAVAVRVERRVGIDVENRRETPIIGLVHVGIDAKRAFLEAPELPHRHVFMDLAPQVLDADALG